MTNNSKFREFAAIWLDKIKARRADSTHATYQHNLNKIVLDRIGDLRLRS
ncbi:hypothetical protein [Saccharopolyspora soli]